MNRLSRRSALHRWIIKGWVCEILIETFGLLAIFGMRGQALVGQTPVPENDMERILMEGSAIHPGKWSRTPDGTLVFVSTKPPPTYKPPIGSMDGAHKSVAGAYQITPGSRSRSSSWSMQDGKLIGKWLDNSGTVTLFVRNGRLYSDDAELLTGAPAGVDLKSFLNGVRGIPPGTIAGRYVPLQGAPGHFGLWSIHVEFINEQKLREIIEVDYDLLLNGRTAKSRYRRTRKQFEGDGTLHTIGVLESVTNLTRLN